MASVGWILYKVDPIPMFMVNTAPLLSLLSLLLTVAYVSTPPRPDAWVTMWQLLPMLVIRSALPQSSLLNPVSDKAFFPILIRWGIYRISQTGLRTLGSNCYGHGFPTSQLSLKTPLLASGRRTV